MKKSFLLIALILTTTLQIQAFEEYILSTESRLSKIYVENPEILKIQPVVTIDNAKNTLFITPLKEGQTSFNVLKDGTEKITFKVNIKEEEVIFSEIDGFDIVSFDEPPIIFDFNIDPPPLVKKKEKTEVINIDGAIVDKNLLNDEEGENG